MNLIKKTSNENGPQLLPECEYGNSESKCVFKVLCAGLFLILAGVTVILFSILTPQIYAQEDEPFGNG